MAVKLRLKRMGSKKKPFYRIVAADSRVARDGKFIELVGTYNPVSEPAEVKINEEVAQITGNTTWDEKTATNSFYFDSKTDTASTTCTDGNTTGCQYGWLYDRTHTSCTTYGCLNNSDQETYGYWTASSRADYSNLHAWSVYYNASVNSDFVGYRGVLTSNLRGVRPVITILKSKLS